MEEDDPTCGDISNAREMSREMEGPLAQWACIIDALPFCAAIIDSDGEVVLSNRAQDVLVGSKFAKIAGAVPSTQTKTEDHEWRLRSITSDGAFRLATAESYRNEDDLMSRFFSLGNPLFVVYDTNGKILQANEAWRNVLGYDEETLFCLDSWNLLPADDQLSREAVEKDLRTKGSAEATYPMRTATGEYRTIRWSLEFDGQLNRGFGVGRDITDELRKQDELTRKAYTDHLTGLPNRAALMTEIDRWLGGQLTPAILFCDLDKFKAVNDSLGHRGGDQLLVDLASRLNEIVTAPDSMVARLGGDEFVVLLGAATETRADITAHHILSSLNEPFHIFGNEVRLELSIGVALAEPEADACDAETLIERADRAVYRSKRSESKSVSTFDVIGLRARHLALVPNDDDEVGDDADEVVDDLKATA